MAQVGNVCARALRLIGVQDPNEAITADDFAAALEALNAMLLRWEASGISMGWSASSNPSDELNVPDEALEAVVFQLALRLAVEYQAPITSALAQGAAAFLDELRRDVRVANPIKYRTTAAPLGYSGPRWNIYNDSPV